MGEKNILLINEFRPSNQNFFSTQPNNYIYIYICVCVCVCVCVCLCVCVVQLFQNKHQQDGTYALSFISRLVVLYSTCFELQGAHHQEFTFPTLYRQSLAYCIIFCCVPPVLLRVLSETDHVGERVEYSKRLHSMPETACTV